MKQARIRLVLCTALFVGWIGWLAYLALGTSRPTIVLSRPQFLISELDIVAEVDERDGPVRVVEVLYPPSSDVQPGDPIVVENLRSALRSRKVPRFETEENGRTVKSDSVEWEVPGRFILPLVHISKTKDQEFRARVAPLPPSPGFSDGRPRIYPATPETLAQLRDVPKAVGRQP